MTKASILIFRRVTRADFFNIYKPTGTEIGGGGQSYIDFDTSNVPLRVWKHFFTPVKPKLMARNRPTWEVRIRSIGVPGDQTVKIGQRRQSSVSVRSQKIESREGNRVRAWHPRYTGFPAPRGKLKSSSDSEIADLIKNLVVYLIRDSKGQFWAGWVNRESPNPEWKIDSRLLPMFTERDGWIELDPQIEFDEDSRGWPFNPTKLSSGGIKAESAETTKKPSRPKTRSRAPKFSTKSEDEIIEALFDEDQQDSTDSKSTERTQKVRKRNAAIVKSLKRLYQECQISGAKYIFRRADGSPYTEVHHLVPLGSGGADSPLNLIVVSAHIHRMMHYAVVEGIDLSRISNCKLAIRMNGNPYTITWHPKHEAAIRSAAQRLAKK